MMTYPEFKKAFSLSLNQQQEAAVCQTEGPSLLLAVPGSGKTTVIVARLGYLLYCKNIPPSKLLTLTYTVAATRDMRRRFAETFGEQAAERLAFRTINGICASIIAAYVRSRGREPFRLLSSDGESGILLREIFRRQTHSHPTDGQIKDLRTRIAYCKNKMLSEEEIGQLKVEGLDFAAFYHAYCDCLTQRKLMDFDDQLVIAYRILHVCPEIAADFCGRWQYLSVDEAQDTSLIQHKIIAKLAERHRNLFMVGDEDQSIYGFRAAYPEALMRFEKDHPGAHILLMETNYRSSGAIVERADALIRRNKNRRDKTMHAARGPGDPIRYRILEDQKNQAAYLAKIAQDCDRTTAVLYRNNDSALPLIDLLEQKGIPYRCRQPESLFFTHPVIRDLSDILRFSQRPSDQSLFMEIIYKLDFKVKKETIIRALKGHPAGQRDEVFQILGDSGLLEPWAAQKVAMLRGCFARMPRQTSLEALLTILRRMGYADYLEKRGGDMAKAEILMALAAQNPCQETFLAHLEELKQRIDQKESTETSCNFWLSTIHSSKGLEYDRVFLIDMREGILPTAEGSSEAAMTAEEKAQLEEDRRIFYVGVTRAKNQLEIISCENSFGQPATPISRFVPQLLGSVPSKKQSLRPTIPKATEISLRRPASTPALLHPEDFPAGSLLAHKNLGPCRVLRRYGVYAEIETAAGEKKTLELALCLRYGLIPPC